MHKTLSIRKIFKIVHDVPWYPEYRECTTAKAIKTYHNSRRGAITETDMIHCIVKELQGIEIDGARD